MQLSWPAPANNGSAITSYKIYRSTTAGAETFLNSTASTSFNDTGLTTGTTYFYKVSAVNAIGEGPQSVEVAATPAGVPAAPAITATAGSSSVALSWSAPAHWRERDHELQDLPLHDVGHRGVPELDHVDVVQRHRALQRHAVLLQGERGQRDR